MVARICNPSYLGDWGRRIAWTQEVQVAVNWDCTTALQPGWWQNKILSQKKKKNEPGQLSELPSLQKILNIGWVAGHSGSCLGGWGGQITRSGVWDQPGQYGETACLLKIKKLKKISQGGGTCLWSQLLRRLRQENCFNLGRGDCSEQRSCHYTPAWATTVRLQLKEKRLHLKKNVVWQRK